MNLMRIDRRLIMAIGVIGLATLVWLLITIGLIASTLTPEQRALVAEQLAPRWGLIGLTWVLGLVSISATLRWLFRRYATAPARLVEQTQVLLAAPKAAPMDHQGTKETKALAEVIFQLASQRDSLREDVATQINQASQSVQAEKNRLAALMAELTQSVVVCNLDGRIILYNSRARLQFKALSVTPQLAGGAELMGIGRSIYAVFERQLVTHALESIRQRISRGAASPSAQFVTTTQAGQLLKVQMAPVRQVDASGAAAEISGFVLMLDNVTRAFEEEHVRDQLLHGLTEGSRSSLANIQAAVDMLAYPDLEADMRERFLTVVREEVHSMSQRITSMTQKATQGLKARWPMEEMLGADVLLASRRRIEARSKRSVTLENLDASIWLRVDSFSLTQALDYLAMRLVDDFDIKFFRLRLQANGNRAQLDLIWTGRGGAPRR
ncbi:MAG: DNA polymerase III subunit epsilon [Comamonadaceae bacterium]|nr:MAG: DNA polymerase III subunit epsilon [Comamonadaceae bacterium]